MKISYILPDFDERAYSGGLYVIFEHCNGMRERGHEVRVFNNTGKRSKYLRLDIPVEVHRNDPSIVESDSPDIIVGTYWHTYFFINRMKEIIRNNTKLCFLVQGDDRLIYDRINRPLIYKAMKARYMGTTPIFKIAVSRYLQDVLKDDFGEESIYIRNGLDVKEVLPLLPKSEKTVIVARYDTSAFRGWDTADKVLRRVSTERRDVEVHLFEMKDKPPTGYKSFFHKGLFGEDLLRLFKSGDIYLSASRYEGFGYPMIEAMSQGSSVCCTDAGGNREFCIDGETALVSPRDDAEGLYRNLTRLMDDAALRKRIRTNGMDMAKRFGWKDPLDRLEEFFGSIALQTSSLRGASSIYHRATKQSLDCFAPEFTLSEANVGLAMTLKRVLFIYNTDPFVTHKDWVNVEESTGYLLDRGFAATARLFIDKHPLKFARSRLEILIPPERLSAFRCNIFYSKKLKTRLPFLSRPIFTLCNIIDLLSGREYACVMLAGGKNILLKFLCILLNIRFHYLDFQGGKFAEYDFDHYTKEDLRKEADYRALVDNVVEAALRSK